MKVLLLTPLALALLSAGGFVQQKEGVPKQEPKAVPAAAALVKPATKCDLMLPVTGLTVENAAKVKTALEGLKEDLYRCADCKTDFLRAGDCPKCKKPVTATKMAVLGTITTDPTKGQIALQTKEGMMLKLSSLERVLLPEMLKIDEAKLMLAGTATLVVGGTVPADQGKALQAALNEAKLFQTAMVKTTPAGLRIHVAAGTTAPTLTRTREVVGKVDATFKITDVIWNEWTPPAAG